MGGSRTRVLSKSSHSLPHAALTLSLSYHIQLLQHISLHHLRTDSRPPLIVTTADQKKNNTKTNFTLFNLATQLYLNVGYILDNIHLAIRVYTRQQRSIKG